MKSEWEHVRPGESYFCSYTGCWAKATWTVDTEEETVLFWCPEHALEKGLPVVTIHGLMDVDDELATEVRQKR